MSEQDADTVIILSSELIAEVMEVHFNKVMFKKKVKIVDLKPTETGYMFSLAFVTDTLQSTVYTSTGNTSSNNVPIYKDVRDNKG